MEKNADAFRTISEVADELDLPQHVLRFWETRFTQIKPLKRGGGRRFYRPDDIELLRVIRQLLYGEGYTIKGVQKILKEQGVRASILAFRAAVAVGGDRMSLIFSAAAESGGVSQMSGTQDLPLGQASEESYSALLDPALSETLGPDGFGRSSASLADSDLLRLKALLGELAECERILQAARRA